MNDTILLIDNDTRYVDKLTEVLEEFKFKTKTINNLESIDISNEVNYYDVFYIRLAQQTKSLIKMLCDEEKKVIVLATRDTDSMMNEIHSLSPSDYIITSEIQDVYIASNIAKRLLQNKNMKVLVVDDSRTALISIKIILQKQGLECVTYSDGDQAWKYLNSTTSNDIDLVIADYEMPKMDGYELTKLIRTKYLFDELPILILSATANTKIISKFLRIGANDYIPKPYIQEEFIARLSNTLTSLNMFRDIKTMALQDNLTGLNNRTYLFEVGTKTLGIMNRQQSDVSIGLCDIDNFKNVNDTYGHDVGDKALKLVAKTIQTNLRETDFCARFGGEEFVFVLPDCPQTNAIKIAENICKAVEALEFEANGKQVKLTISVGLTSQRDKDLDIMIKKADELMYEAKESGKNKVCHEKNN